ncbi:MAG TPA: ATP-binding cassette domain-containing protein, partial [Polyangiaceae bacterium]|nr:ATP-binding cassette domain-containing protein [Polyangiaceae bacterium]
MTVVVDQICKTFGDRQRAAAVNGVSFAATPGAITTLLGPSGSGKSTVLRMIAGLETPDSGTVSIAGQECTQISPRKRNVGFVFQSYALFRHMSVEQNIAFGMKIRKVPHAERKARVEELL